MSQTIVYVAADWDHDQEVAEKVESLAPYNIHESRSARDSSNFCNVKESLRKRMSDSNIFVLIVGKHTNDITKGRCATCQSYNSHNQSCARGLDVSTESYVDYECRLAEKKSSDGDMKIIVLYKGKIDKNKCPRPVRYKGTHYEIYDESGNFRRQFIKDLLK